MKEIIQQIVEAMTLDGERFTFAFGTQQFQNLFSDNQQLPAVFLDQPITNEYILPQGGGVEEKYPIKLFFCFKTLLSDTPKQQEKTAIQKANAAIVNFINHCQASNDIDKIESASALEDRKSTRLNSSHVSESRMPSSA